MSGCGHWGGTALAFAQSAAAGTDLCGECLPGTFTGEVGAPSCELCSPGKFQNASATTSCEYCAGGFYSATESSTECPALSRYIWLTSIQPFTGSVIDGGILMHIGRQIMMDEVAKDSTLLKGFNMKIV